jgi:hypothetical protein
MGIFNNLGSNPWPDAQRGYNTVRKDVTNFSQRAMQGKLSNRAIAGAGEMFGFHFEPNKETGRFASKGFLGLGGGELGRQNRRLNSLYQARGAKYAGKKVLGFAGKMAGRAIFPTWTAYGMYEAYQEEGIGGLVREGAQNALMGAAMKMAPALAGPLLGLAAVAAIGAGGYAAGNAAREHVRGLRHLELGTPIVDPFGTAATLRQRSLSAMNRTHMNGRMAIGNEGYLLHR